MWCGVKIVFRYVELVLYLQPFPPHTPFINHPQCLAVKLLIQLALIPNQHAQ